MLQQATLTFQNAGKTAIYIGFDDDLSVVFGVADVTHQRVNANAEET